MIQKLSDKIVEIVCILFVCVCIVSMVTINFSKVPTAYCTDMYSDMCYAEEVWNQKTVFPEGWVFGNQLYAVATPNLAALFFGLTKDGCIAMGLAATTMGLLIILSFLWYIKPILDHASSRLFGLACLLALTLFAGNPIREVNGWQLFFTMCSYYACYLIEALLAFGCAIRGTKLLQGMGWGILGMTCLLAFGTGLQSLRQTAVMVCPLIMLEVLRTIYDYTRKGRIEWRNWWITGAIIVSNAAGLLAANIKNAAQVVIFGEIHLNSFSELVRDALPAVRNAVSLVLPVYLSRRTIVVFFFLLAVALFLIYTVCLLVRKKKEAALVGMLLFVFGVLTIFAIEVSTTMNVRNIYYFLLFPMMALALAFQYEHGGRIMKRLLCTGLLIIIVLGGTKSLAPAISSIREPDCYDDVVACLEENGIEIVYSGWNQAEKIAIASDGRIKAGFWNANTDTFIRVNYLCNPEIFDADPSKCGYVFFGKQNADIGIRTAIEDGGDLELVAFFPEDELYIFKSDKQLMKNPQE